MDKKILKKYTDRLFDDFRETHDCSGEYRSSVTNSVLAFGDWLSNADLVEICEVIPEIEDKEVVDELKRYVSEQVDLYLLRNAPRW
jgi:hypothetical protein